jgi:hypothetical protein
VRRDVLEAMADEILRGDHKPNGAYGREAYRTSGYTSEHRETAKAKRAEDDRFIKAIRRSGRSLSLTRSARYALTVANLPAEWRLPVERGPTPISKGWRDSL